MLNGMERAKLAWSRLPNSEDGEVDEVGVSKKIDGSSVESLDYEVIENHAYREEQAQRGKLYVGYYVVVKWFFALLIGIGTGLAAVFINISVENFAGWKYSLTFAIIQKSYIAGFVVYVLINLVLVFSSVFIITQFAPAAAGSGIPEIKGYLNGVDTHGILLFRTLIGKIFGSIGSVGGGLALGKEGPLVHTGACIASLLGQGGSTKYHLSSRWLQFFNSDRDRRDLVTCGCAAGVAAAFRAPVGGVLFALEEVTSWWRSQLMWRVFFTSAIVAVVVRTAMGWCKSGKCGHFGSGGFIIWDISGGQEDYSFEELLPMAVIGVIGGLLGALFNQLTRYITYWRRNYLHKKGNRVKIIEVCLISLITSVISFGLPLFRECTPCPESDPSSGIECPRPPGMYGNYVNFFCGKDNEYNDLATIFFNTQDDAIRNLFSAKTIHEYSAQGLLTFLVMFYTLAVVTFGTAVPAGQFVPGIMIGSTYGRLVGMFVVSFYKKLNIEEGTYALLGAASFLGGSMRMTVSLCVIMVEITNNLKLLPLIMLVLLISKAVGDAFNEGLYEEQAHLRGIPLLESRPKYEMRKMTAKGVCGNRKVVYLPRVVKVADIVFILKSNNHNGFPVIDHARSGETLVTGLMLRSHLLVLLQSKVDFQHSPLPNDSRGGSLPIRHNFSEFVKPVSSKGISIHDINLTPDDLEMYIDLARTPYDKEKIVGMEANCERVVATKKDRKNKAQKTKTKKPEERKDLSSVRVIQRRMAYVIGLPLTLADEDRLQRKEYFGQYGKVAKVSLSRTAGGDIQQFVNDTCSVYITYSKEEEAIRCIQSVHGFVLEGRFLRASFGTAKYCHAWLRNMPCTNPTCLYLHSIGAEEDSFSKDEEAAVHTRNRVHQIVGDTHNMQRRSGNMLPPPLDDPFNGNSIAADKVLDKIAPKDTAYATETSTGHMTCSYSSNDRDGRIKTPNKTFVDIVGRSSSGPEKDGNVAEDRKILNLCSDFSSVTIDTDYHLETEYSNSMLRKVSSRSQLPIGLPRDKDSQEYSLKPFREPSSFTVSGRADFTPSDACIAKGRSCLMLDSGRQALPGSCSDVREDFLSFDDQRSKGSDTLSQESSVLPSSYPIRISDRSNGRAQQPKEMCSLSDFNVKCSTVHSHVDEASMPFSCVNSILSDGYNERKFHSSIESDRNFRSSNSFSNEEIVEHLRRLDNDNITNDDDSSALDAVESSIISNILSLDFDSCDNSSTLSHSLAELFDGNGGRHGSWNFRNSEKSMFSFAKEENSVNQATDLDSSFSNIGQVSKRCALLPDSMEHEDHYFCGPQHHVSRAPSLTPPGFSVPSRDPPPGFSAYERTNRVVNPTSGNHLVNTTSLPNSQYCAPSAGNINNTREFDLIDPAILVVGRGKATDVSNNSGLETWPTSTQPTTYEDQARLWLLMQQSASAYQEPKFPPIFMQETTPSTHQQLNFSGRIGDGFSPIGDTFGLSSRFMDQHQTYNPSPFATQLSSQQKYGNGHVSNGHWPGMDEVRLRNEVGMAEIQRNEMLGFNKFFPGYGDLMLQMPSTGDVYNRAYGL